MNLLERAKALIAEKATKIAITAVPLAALVVFAPQAKATPGLQFGIPSGCTVNFGVSGGCAASQLSAQGGLSSTNAIEGYTTSDIFSDFLTNTVQFTYGGTATGSLASAQNLPVGWDFYVNFPSGGVNWNIVFSLTSNTACGPCALTSPPAVTYQVNPSGTAPANSGSADHVFGNTTLSLPAGVVFSSYQVVFTATSASNFSITVPQGTSFDLNPVISSPTPEPASLALAAVGLAGILFRRRRS